MVLCAVFILGLHFNVNWRFDSTMQIFFAIQIFAIHFYVNLLSPNWYSYANFLLGHWCTLLTCKLGNLSHLKERHLKRHRVEFLWQRKYKAKWYSHVFALVLEKFLLLLWNSCSRQYEGVVRSIVCTLTDGQPHQIHALGDWIEPPWITLEGTGWMSNRGTPRLHKQVKTKEGKNEMGWVVSHSKGLNTLQHPREGEIQCNSVSQKYPEVPYSYTVFRKTWTERWANILIFGMLICFLCK